VFSNTFTTNKVAERSVLVNVLELACILIYASFTMNSAMVWVELNTVVDQKDYDKLSVIYWIQFEFLIFMVNLLAIPFFLLIAHFSFWHYGKNDYEGGTRIMFSTSSDRMC
jgi:hypothetical protein